MSDTLKLASSLISGRQSRQTDVTRSTHTHTHTHVMKHGRLVKQTKREKICLKERSSIMYVVQSLLLLYKLVRADYDDDHAGDDDDDAA